MRIEDFPRPKDDNGRGVHWSARLYHDTAQPSLDYWVDELVAMKIKWVKLLDDGGGSSLNLCRKLLAADIMPIVRFYFPELNPHRMGGRELDTVSRLVDIGVRYFESNNEPDLPAEWRDGQLPPNWLDIVVDNFIRDADAVLARGGLLAVPALGPGSRANPVALIVQKGRRDLFERGCWVAIHNYTLNHPLDYPDDDVNQLGRPLTEEEYRRYARWAYSHLTYEEIVARGIPISASDYHKFQNWAWDGRPMEAVNQLRAASKRPGSTPTEDSNCFRGFEAAGKMIYDALGFYVPVISTEGGPVVGWGDDQRYPKVNPETHKEWQLGIVRFMQTQAPRWYFAMCTWLLASRPLGDFNPTWEQMSWYTHFWDLQFGLNGQLPVVQALKDEPSVVRPELRQGNGAVAGVVRLESGRPASNLPLRLTGQGRDLTTVTDAEGAYRFEGLAAGVYRLSTGDTVLAESIAVAEDRPTTYDVRLPAGQQSALSGRVLDAAGAAQRGAVVTLRRGQTQVAETTTADDGRYRFSGLPTGSYWVSTEGAGVAGIVLDGWSAATVDLTVPAPPGMRYRVVTKRLLSRAETGNDRKFFGRVLDQAGNGLNGVQVEMAWANAAPGTQFPRQTTPRDPFKPAGNFEFLHSPGEFLLRVVQGDWPSDEADGLKTVNVPGREGDPITYEVNFQLLPTGATGNGRIYGAIANGAGLGLTLWSGARSWATVLGDDGAFSFDGLPAGDYRVTVEGAGEVATLTLAEGASLRFNYTVAPPPTPEPEPEPEPEPPQPPTTGAIAGVVTLSTGQPAADTSVLLYREDSFVAQQVTDASGAFRFEGVQPGVYRLDVAALGPQATDVIVRAGETTTVNLRLPPTGTPDKLLAAYMLFGSTRSALLLFDVALPYVRRHGLTAGFSLDDAKQARTVTIVGGEDMVGAIGEQALWDAGCQVQRLPGDPFALAEALQL